MLNTYSRSEFNNNKKCARICDAKVSQCKVWFSNSMRLIDQSYMTTIAFPRKITFACDDGKKNARTHADLVTKRTLLFQLDMIDRNPKLYWYRCTSVRKVIYHTVDWEIRQNFALEDFPRYLRHVRGALKKKHVTSIEWFKNCPQKTSQIFVKARK